MTRRYRIAENQIYSDFFDRLKNGSPILNPNLNSLSHLPLSWAGKQQLVGLLAELQGCKEKPDHCLHDGKWVPCKLKEAENRLLGIRVEFERYRRKLANEGRPVPDDMPREMQIRLWQAEAKFDIVQEEIEKVQKTLDGFLNVEKTKSDHRVLKNGPVGEGKMDATPDCPSGRLVLLDGQIVAPDAACVLRIADPRSPYDGMRTCDYFLHVVKPYQREQSRLRKEVYAKHRASGDDEALPKISRPPLPPWPDCVKRPEQKEHKIERKKETAPKVKRTKKRPVK